MWLIKQPLESHLEAVINGVVIILKVMAKSIHFPENMLVYD